VVFALSHCAAIKIPRNRNQIPPVNQIYSITTRLPYIGDTNLTSTGRDVLDAPLFLFAREWERRRVSPYFYFFRKNNKNTKALAN